MHSGFKTRYLSDQVAGEEECETLAVLYTTLFQLFPRGQRSFSAYINTQNESFSI